AIAWAVTEHLHNVVGCKTIFATHYHELTQLTEELAHARNFNVAVREAGDEIVFLHRLEPGGADRSYGIHVGQLAGLPGAVVGRAWEVLKLLEAGHHVARQPPPPAPDAQQLALFAPGTHPLVAESSGYSGLDSAALAGARKLRFAPARRRGLAVATAFLQPIEFRRPASGGTAGKAKPDTSGARRPTPRPPPVMFPPIPPRAR